MEEKTEKPTPRKIAQAKERLGGAYSLDLIHSLLMVGGTLFLYFYSSTLLQHFKSTFYWPQEIDPRTALKAAFSPLFFFLLILSALVILLLGSAYIFQRGWVVKRSSTKSFGEKKREAAYSIIYTLVKISLFLGIGFFFVNTILSQAKLILSASFQEQIYFFFHELFIMTLLITLAFFLLSFLDLGYKKWLRWRSLKMSRAEIKEEEMDEGGRQK